MGGKDYIEDCLKFLTILGLNPCIYTKSVHIRGKILLIVHTTTMIQVVLGLFDSTQGFDILVDTCICFAAMLQANLKGIMMIFYRNEFIDVIDSVKLFWPRDKYGTKASKHLDNTQSFVEPLLKLFRVTTFVASSFLLVKPLFMEERVLPLHGINLCDTKNNLACYTLICIFHIFVTYYTALMMMGFDCLFSVLLSYGYCELEQVKYALKNLSIHEEISGDETLVLEEMASLVKYHNRVLEFIDRITKIYSKILLLQFTTSLLGGSLSLFMLTIDGMPTSLDTTLQYGIFCMAAIFEVLLYCVTGEIIGEQTESVADAAYESIWWVKHQPKLRRAIGIVLHRSQKRYQIKAGGIWDLNMDTFARILKTTMSVLAFTQTVGQKK